MPADFKRFTRPTGFDDGGGPRVYDDGRLRVEHDNYYVSCDGAVLKFARTEFLLLSRLAMNAGRVVEAGALWRHAWGDRKPYNGESLHVHMYRLRLKLAPYGLRIETMVNVGYSLLPAAAEHDARRRRESA
jgi:DNA-binding response OmpR family regulator